MIFQTIEFGILKIHYVHTITYVGTCRYFIVVRIGYLRKHSLPKARFELRMSEILFGKPSLR